MGNRYTDVSKQRSGRILKGRRAQKEMPRIDNPEP
jgi:hypothetical protein